MENIIARESYQQRVKFMVIGAIFYYLEQHGMHWTAETFATLSEQQVKGIVRLLNMDLPEEKLAKIMLDTNENLIPVLRKEILREC